ncbi:MAG: diaminopimelate epimerase [Actinomycetia bacterium]|nr:diaminopimelate epimerase [Actinomycetes bacterium]
MTVPPAPVVFSKGHGTGNDFVILPDPQAALDLSAAQVAALCDRHFGIGADGVLRVVPTRAVPEVQDQADVADWFMDYRNADGSLAEMCGNGARVFARYLVQNEMAAPGRITFATRAGTLWADVPITGEVSVGMGTPASAGLQAVAVSVPGLEAEGVAVHFPNPHVVIPVADIDQAGELRESPQLAEPELLPEGTNFEFVQVLSPGHVRIRIHERGVGETLACGTGACAVAWLHVQQMELGPQPNVRVDLPGGVVTVSQLQSGEWVLTGPAELVATGVLEQGWWHAA